MLSNDEKIKRKNQWLKDKMNKKYGVFWDPEKYQRLKEAKQKRLQFLQENNAHKFLQRIESIYHKD